MQPPTPRILETKLNPPAFVATQVPRTAIREEVASAAVKLVLVRAPAGFGKTTAMAQIRERMEAQGIATAWLTLDRADNDVSRFLDCLAEAVQRLGVEDPRGNGGNNPFDAVAALAAHESPFTLFLDDFERVQEPAVLGLVREIVEHLPRRGQIVIGSRSLPDLGLGRLRARGQLTEIDTDRLRFSLEETGAFFGLRQALPPEMLSLLHRKTEGWVAAIWLASMALERHGTGAATGFVERFSGSDRAVAEYLAEDVLAHQPKEVRDFLLRTSILRQLDASVCQALCPRMDCAAILERLAASNLFLTPVMSGDGGAWRYHSLFADFLRAQLAREMPGEPARLHLAASGWYESHGRPVPAIDHAIEGGDHPHALNLLDHHAAQFLEEGRMRMLARWFSAIPEHQLREHPFLQPISLWATCFTHGPWDAMRQLDASGCLDSPIAEVRASAHTLVPLLLAMQDRHDEAYEAGRLSLARLPTGLAFADSVLLNAMAHILAVRGDQHEAQRLLDAARREQGNSAFNRMYTESLAGLFDLHEGRLRQATARLRMAVDSTHAVSYNHSHGNAWAGVLYAGAVYETNQLAQAERLLNVYLPMARDVGLPDHMILSHAMRSRLAFHAGDIDAAFQALTELEYLGHQRQLPRVVAGAKLERSRMLLLQGNGPASHDELLRADDPALWERERRQRLPAHDLDYLALAKARWEIAFGDARAALSVLDAELHAALAVARNRRVLKLKVLRALALQRAGDPAAAAEEFAEVLQAASQEGFMRLILDEGPAVGTLVHRCAAAMQEGGGDPILADHLQRLLQAVGPMAAPTEPAAPPGDAIEEPLTRKEIRVLQLLAEGYSNSAMAEKLFVSDSTVRTHLRNINMKLDAKSRTQAVAIARRLGVIR
ncbi:LuxR C-terminal-related transcriptional regulator [Variovorax sp. CAN2819]|uniref:LuxR C-terminal-related transcriptional regulator n=1 Tax=Variovorax sp. CAN15 TaxID=3046727 RepID=UPI0026492619|nr:LuxR C-terminal-related transcriptional regulator [Variovorax sp. CAN15]MDN6883750.1 LuxR C-terminal-related transcriptional regulator [Variovorax sp. CAN15]